jgi:hypothetical protein
MTNTPNFTTLEPGVLVMIFCSTVVFTSTILIRDMKDNCTI